MQILQKNQKRAGPLKKTYRSMYIQINRKKSQEKYWKQSCALNLIQPYEHHQRYLFLSVGSKEGVKSKREIKCIKKRIIYILQVQVQVSKKRKIKPKNNIIVYKP